jgi:hypothetical protein
VKAECEFTKTPNPSQNRKLSITIATMMLTMTVMVASEDVVGNDPNLAGPPRANQPT